MPNSYQPWQVFVNEAMAILKNDLVFLKGVNRDSQYLFAKPGMKSGNTVNLRYPARFIGRQGEAYTPEAYAETSYAVTVRPLQGVDVDAPSTDWTLNINNIREDILKPAMAQLVNNIERDCMQLGYQGVSNFVGTPSTALTTSAPLASARAILMNEAAPSPDKIKGVLNPDTNASLVPAFQTLYNPQVSISSQWEKGLITKRTLGADYFESQNIWSHRIGPLGGTPAVVGAGNTGSSIPTSGWTASGLRLRKGDIISFAGVRPVNPMNRVPYGASTYLRTFTVTADVNADGGGLATIPIFPALIPAPDQFATVDVSPDAGALINVWGAAAAGQAALANTYQIQNMIYDPSAFTFAGISQEIPKGSVEMAWEATDPDTGVQLRFLRQFDGRSNNFINRFDVLYAFGVPYGQLGVRAIAG